MIRLARKIAKRAKHNFAFHACVVTRGGARIAAGFNHGEIHAERNALGQLWPSHRKGTKVWSIRVTPGGKLAMAKPCARCEAYMRKHKVKVVMYSTEAGTIERMKL